MAPVTKRGANLIDEARIAAMSLFWTCQQLLVVATHSAQTNRQSRSMRTRSETAFATLVSAFLLFSVPDCHVIRRYLATGTKTIRRITVYLCLNSRKVVSVHRKSEVSHVEMKSAGRLPCLALKQFGDRASYPKMGVAMLISPQW
jgi:hypothetical protein